MTVKDVSTSPHYFISQETVDELTSEWKPLLHFLSYMGPHKSKKYAAFDSSFGSQEWIPAHSFAGKTVSRLEACYLYEDSYYLFLKENHEVRDWLVSTASEVYDIGLSNIDSGLEYTAQECSATHLQDIAIRRSLTRLALDNASELYNRNLTPIPIFKGDHPVQVRGRETEGFVLNPGQVPFHKPNLILGNYTRAWWNQGSVEHAYQANKALLVNPSVVIATPTYSTSDGVYSRFSVFTCPIKAIFNQLHHF
jgi:hypothetical protein